MIAIPSVNADSCSLCHRFVPPGSALAQPRARRLNAFATIDGAHSFARMVAFIMLLQPSVWCLVVAAVFALLASGDAIALEVGETEPIVPREVHITDGDTIRVGGLQYRLVGFDAPETGSRARCEAEVDKGYAATAALVDLVHSGKPLTLERIACSCAPTAPEGSMGCNYARRCGTLRVAGEDVGAILMREGHAKPYPYKWPHPPPKPRWCE